MRYVWRHLPLNDVHPHAQLAAEAAEAAAGQGAFWAMHDLLLRHQDALLMPDLIRYATELGLDPGRFRDQLASRAGAARVAEDVDSADLSGVSGTPTFFINGRRHYGSYDIARADRGRPGREGRQPGLPATSRSAARFLSRDLPRASIGCSWCAGKPGRQSSEGFQLTGRWHAQCRNGVAAGRAGHGGAPCSRAGCSSRPPRCWWSPGC